MPKTKNCCGEPMKIVSSAGGKSGGLSWIVFFQCSRCGYWITNRELEEASL